MTALTEYQRLESPGVWRASPRDQRRDVVVSVGDATLVLYDKANRALGHWSLPAIERRNPGATPAIYAPAPDATDELELADPDMIAAIEKVRQVVDRRRPRPGRLRFYLLGGGLAAVLALTVFWLPDALIQHAANVVPSAARDDLGQRLLTHVHRVAGHACETPNGRRALDRLKTRLLAGRPANLAVLAGGARAALHLPGGLILLNRTLVEDYEDPAVAAGYVLAEAQRAAQTDPVARLLRWAGPLAAVRLLTTGDVPEDRLAAYAETLVAEPAAPLADEALLARFAAAAVPSTPYAYARDLSGETTLGLIEADPMANNPYAPILADGDWVALQAICGD